MPTPFETFVNDELPNRIASTAATQTAGRYLRYTGTAKLTEERTPAQVLSDIGGVAGPGSSTNHAIARYDGTTGRLLKNSTVTLDDTGVLFLTSQAGAWGSGSDLFLFGVTSVRLVDEAATPILYAEKGAGSIVNYLKVKNSASGAVLPIQAIGADTNISIDIQPKGTGQLLVNGSPISGGSGETNTASNVGTAGVGVFKQKTGVDLEFKKINAGSAKITITDDTGNSEVDIDFGSVALADLSDVTAKTGTGTTVVMSTSPVLVTPDIGDFTNALHDHTSLANGGLLLPQSLEMNQDRLISRTAAGFGVATEITCTSFARTILDDADAATVRGTIGAGIGDMLLGTVQTITAAKKFDTATELRFRDDATRVYSNATNELTIEATTKLTLGVNGDTDVGYGTLSQLRPATDTMVDLGSDSKRFRDCNLSGNLYIKAGKIIAAASPGLQILDSSAHFLSFLGATPVGQSTGWSVASHTALKTFDPATVTLAELGRVVGTMMNANLAYGLFGA